MKSPKEISLDSKIMSLLKGRAAHMAELMFSDPEIHHMQEYANIVSIKRLNFNDHGPVHMRKVAKNAMVMANLLNEAGIQFNLEKEDIGTFEDSQLVMFIAAMLHDIGMTVGRQNHEYFGVQLSLPIIERLLKEVYPDDTAKRVILRSLIVEGIAGHMATQKIHSLEAGVILIADGCDMEKGRARIPMMISTEAKVGDIHQYSASSIENVKISKGDTKPLRIMVEMTASVGFFQVEEVLFHKIESSTVKPYIELFAGVTGREIKQYL